MIQVMSYELSWIEPKESDVDYKKICEILWKLSDEVRETSNRTVRAWWQWDWEQREYYKKHGSYPKFKEIYGCSLQTKVCHEIEADHDVFLIKASFTTVANDVAKRMDKMKQEIWKGERSIPSYRANQPIPIACTKSNPTIRLSKTAGGDFVVQLSVLSRQGMKYFAVKNDILCFKIDGKLKSFAKAILQRCLSEEYKICTSKLLYNKQKKKWFLKLVYFFEPQDNKELDPNRILGIDLGIVHAVHMAVSDVEKDDKKFIIEGGEITEFRTQIERRRKSIQSQIRTAGDGRNRHGRKRALLPIEHLSHKAANFRNTTNFRYAKHVVDVALEYQCSAIQMENLQGAGKNNSFLQQNWTFYDLQTKIENRAMRFGVAVKRVAPQYTSQRCHKCGFIDPDNRMKAKFCCRQCGWKGNADFNAAKNLATRDIERIIEDTKQASGAK